MTRRRKRYIACDDFLCFAAKVNARSVCCVSLPNRTCFAFGICVASKTPSDTEKSSETATVPGPFCACSGVFSLIVPVTRIKRSCRELLSGHAGIHIPGPEGVPPEAGGRTTGAVLSGRASAPGGTQCFCGPMSTASPACRPPPYPARSGISRRRGSPSAPWAPW